MTVVAGNIRPKGASSPASVLHAEVDVSSAGWWNRIARGGGPDRCAKRSGGKYGGLTLDKIILIVQRPAPIAPS
jgi:hypothetical protein